MTLSLVYVLLRSAVVLCIVISIFSDRMYLSDMKVFFTKGYEAGNADW